MFSDVRNKPINAFYFGIYTNSSYLRFYIEGLYENFFISYFEENRPQGAFAFQRFNELWPTLFLKKDEWLFYAPQLAVKEFSTLELISEVRR